MSVHRSTFRATAASLVAFNHIPSPGAIRLSLFQLPSTVFDDAVGRGTMGMRRASTWRLDPAPFHFPIQSVPADVQFGCNLGNVPMAGLEFTQNGFALCES